MTLSLLCSFWTASASCRPAFTVAFRYCPTDGGQAAITGWERLRTAGMLPRSSSRLETGKQEPGPPD
jgi:hypothetical protein